jgi:uncharacterized protein (DUF486 family)
MRTILLLFASNVFMTIAWYWHLNHKELALWKAILISWAIAFFEYCLTVPANRWGSISGLNAFQLKITQEVITLGVFVPFAMVYMDQPFKLDFVWAGLCMVGAVYFIFRT